MVRMESVIFVWNGADHWTFIVVCVGIIGNSLFSKWRSSFAHHTFWPANDQNDWRPTKKTWLETALRGGNNHCTDPTAATRGRCWRTRAGQSASLLCFSWMLSFRQTWRQSHHQVTFLSFFGFYWESLPVVLMWQSEPYIAGTTLMSKQNDMKNKYVNVEIK